MNPKHIILLICAGHSEQWIARTAVDSGETPWHFTARRTKFHWGSRRSADGWSQKGKLGQKSQQRRVMWPLREGREIWGVDGAFASMTWRHHCVRDGVAPSANELAWFYMGSDSVTQWAFPKRSTQCWVTYEREPWIWNSFSLSCIVFVSNCISVRCYTGMGRCIAFSIINRIK